MHPTKFRFIWQNGFREDFFFRNQPIRNKNCLWWPCLLTDRDEMSNCNRGLSIDASIKFRFIGLNGFRGAESKKSDHQKQGSPVAAMFVIGSGQNEYSL